MHFHLHDFIAYHVQYNYEILFFQNYKRVIETWFDEKYKEYFYTREPLARYLDMGDITEQLKLKEKLKCKDFSWFMKNVAYDVLDKYPELPPNIYWGEVSYCQCKNLFTILLTFNPSFKV